MSTVAPEVAVAELASMVRNLIDGLEEKGETPRFALVALRNKVDYYAGSLRLENTTAREGCSRCECGCKYWEKDRCIDCGTAHDPVRHDQND